MLRVAIVGNIASGKSTVELSLKTSGYVVLDSDRVCHELLYDTDVMDAFSEFDVFENGNFSRDKLGKLVFSRRDLKQKLENLLYPKLIIKINEFFEQFKEESVVFVAIPLLFETGMESLFDEIIFVYCDDEIRLKRLIARNNYTEDYAKIRMDAQQSQFDKMQKSDFVINNNSTLSELDKQIEDILTQLVIKD